VSQTIQNNTFNSPTLPSYLLRYGPYLPTYVLLIYAAYFYGNGCWVIDDIWYWAMAKG